MFSGKLEGPARSSNRKGARKCVSIVHRSVIISTTVQYAVSTAAYAVQRCTFHASGSLNKMERHYCQLSLTLIDISITVDVRLIRYLLLSPLHLLIHIGLLSSSWTDAGMLKEEGSSYKEISG